MTWFTIAIMSAIGFSIANAFARHFAGKIDPLYSLIIFVTGAIITSTLGILYFKFLSPKTFIYTHEGAVWALIAGLVWGVGQILLFVTLKNAPLSIAIPLIIGVIGVGGILAGVVFFREPVTLMRIIGAAIVVFGAVILARA